jgi:hypothetical protein
MIWILKLHLEVKIRNNHKTPKFMDASGRLGVKSDSQRYENRI